MGKSLLMSRAHPLLASVQYAALTTQAGRRENNETSATRTFRTGFTASHYYYNMETNDINADVILTIRRNGGDSSLSVTVTASTTGEFEDTGSEVFADDDTGAIELDGSAITGGTTFTGMMALITDYGSETVIVPMAKGGPNIDPSTTEYVGFVYLSDWGQYSLANSRTRVNYDFTARKMQSRIDLNGRTTSSSIALVIDATPSTNLVVTVPGSTTGEFEETTNTEAITAGDDLAWAETTGTGTGTIRVSQVSCECASDVEGEFGLFMSPNPPGQEYEPGTSTTEYWHHAGLYREAEVPASEAVARHKLLIPLILDRLSLFLITNGISATSACTLRKNGSSTGLSASITASTAGLHEDLVSAPVVILPTDEIAMEWATGATGTTMEVMRSSMVARAIPIDNDRLARMGFAASGGGLLPWMW